MGNSIKLSFISLAALCGVWIDWKEIQQSKGGGASQQWTNKLFICEWAEWVRPAAQFMKSTLFPPAWLVGYGRCSANGSAKESRRREKESWVEWMEQKERKGMEWNERSGRQFSFINQSSWSWLRKRMPLPPQENETKWRGGPLPKAGWICGMIEKNEANEAIAGRQPIKLIKEIN